MFVVAIAAGAGEGLCGGGAGGVGDGDEEVSWLPAKMSMVEKTESVRQRCRGWGYLMGLRTAKV